jgi:hypothetical protein
VGRAAISIGPQARPAQPFSPLSPPTPRVPPAAHGFGATEKTIFRDAKAYTVRIYTYWSKKKEGQLLGRNSVLVYT